MSFPPARLSNNEWIWRWQYADIDNYEFLHRIAEPFTVGDKNGWESGTGRAVCGMRGVFEMPGVVSRLGRPRCIACCEALEIPSGDGAPYNSGDPSWRER